MTSRKYSKKPASELLRSASEPFTIRLDEEHFILTRTALKSHVEPSLTRKKEWFFPKLKFLLLDNHILKLRNSYLKTSYEMTVRVEPDRLSFSCSCATLVESLCIHVYKAVDHLLWSERTDYFQKFIPNGMIDLAVRHRKYFSRKTDQHGIDFSPKKSLGAIYQITDNLNVDHISTILGLPTHDVPENLVPAKLTAIAYMIMTASWDKYLPFLLPCLGVLNNDGTNIKGFYPYLNIAAVEEQFKGFFNSAENEIFHICFDMYQMVEESPGSILTREGQERLLSLSVFRFWKTLLPVLSKQEYVYLDDYYGKKYLREKPSIRNVRRITICMDIPKLHFQIIDKGPFYQFHLRVLINGKNVPDYRASTVFFINQAYQYYLLGSLRDSAIVKWMEKSGGYITVFKEHFSDFEKEILSPLWECYDVTHLKKIN